MSDIDIQEIFERYRATCGGRHVYFAPKIPSKLLSNAINSYGDSTSAHDVLVLIDGSRFGGARDGMLITKTHVYSKHADSRTSTRLTEILSVKYAGRSAWNKHKILINDDTKISLSDFGNDNKAALALVYFLWDIAQIARNASNNLFIQMDDEIIATDKVSSKSLRPHHKESIVFLIARAIGLIGFLISMQFLETNTSMIFSFILFFLYSVGIILISWFNKYRFKIHTLVNHNIGNEEIERVLLNLTKIPNDSQTVLFKFNRNRFVLITNSGIAAFRYSHKNQIPKFIFEYEEYTKVNVLIESDFFDAFHFSIESHKCLMKFDANYKFMIHEIKGVRTYSVMVKIPYISQSDMLGLRCILRYFFNNTESEFEALKRKVTFHVENLELSLLEKTLSRAFLISLSTNGEMAAEDLLCTLDNSFHSYLVQSADSLEKANAHFPSHKKLMRIAELRCTLWLSLFQDNHHSLKAKEWPTEMIFEKLIAFHKSYDDFISHGVDDADTSISVFNILDPGKIGRDLATIRTGNIPTKAFYELLASSRQLNDREIASCILRDIANLIEPK